MNSLVDNSSPVSVIVPCFRCSETIERAIESVARQTSRPVEVILIDDGSGDNTVDELRQLRQRYGKEWIKLIEQKENGGPSVARNAGWAMATQPFLAFLDADDSWHPRKIEMQYSWMVKHPEVAFTGHAVVVLRENTRKPEVLDALDANRVSAKKMLLVNQFATLSVMCKRELPFRFDACKRYSEDYYLWLSLVLRGYDAYRFNTVLAYWYKAPFGEGGLSGQLWAMERGELDTYWQLWKKKMISSLTLSMLSCYSLLKFVRRVMVFALRRILL